MKTLRKGDTGTDVLAWETFLVGRGYGIVADGKFGDETQEATRAFQKANGLTADGTVGPKTYGIALGLGFPGVVDPSIDKESPNWPPRPKDANPLSKGDRERIFGRFEYVGEPTPSNPEAIRITDGWADRSIVTVTVPQLIGISGAPKDGRVSFNGQVERQLRGLFGAWEKAGLLPLVTSWGGSWAPRFIRGSRTSLSNHAWGTAFDINVPENGLGAVPALVGKKGSVRELVSLAYEHGFFWGGWFTGRPDGMHFEVARLL